MLRELVYVEPLAERKWLSQVRLRDLSPVYGNLHQDRHSRDGV